MKMENLGLQSAHEHFLTLMKNAPSHDLLDQCRQQALGFLQGLHIADFLDEEYYGGLRDEVQCTFLYASESLVNKAVA